MGPPGTSPTHQVGYITDPEMLLHKDPNGVHAERPERLEVLDNALAPIKDKLVCLEPREATFEELKTCHDPDYIEEIFNTSDWKPEHYLLHSKRPGFNYYCKDTLKAALKAAGCVTTATKAVLDGTVGSAFAAVRPPSHHAGTEGATKSLQTSEQNDVRDNMLKQKAPAAGPAAPADEEAPPCPRADGFCFFSNVGVAATMAASGFLEDSSSTSPPATRRVVVLDWDVHHGNGLEEVLKDKDDVFFVSLHRHGDRGDGKPFYPGTGAADSFLNKGWNLNIPFEGKGYGDADYQAAFSLVILPILEELKPDLIIIAAGFDAVKGDNMGGFCLSAEMYGHMLSQLRRVQPKVVLALEGGYNPELVGACATSCIKVLVRGQDGISSSGEPDGQQKPLGEDAHHHEPMQGGVRGTPKKKTMAMLKKVSGLMAPFWSSMKDFKVREEAYNAEVCKRNKASQGWITAGLDPSLIMSTPEGTSSCRRSRARKPTAKAAASVAADLDKQQHQQGSKSAPEPPMAALAATSLLCPASDADGASLKRKNHSARVAMARVKKIANDTVTTATGSRKSSRKSSRRSRRTTPATPANTAAAAGAVAEEDSPPSRATTMMLHQEEVKEGGSSGGITPSPTAPDASAAPPRPLLIAEEAMTPAAADEPFVALSKGSEGSLPAAAAAAAHLAATSYTGSDLFEKNTNNKISQSRRASETVEDKTSSPPGTAVSTKSKRARMDEASGMPFLAAPMTDPFVATPDEDGVSSALLPEQLFAQTAAFPPTGSSLLPEWLFEWALQQQEQVDGAAAAPITDDNTCQPHRIRHQRTGSDISTHETLRFWEEREEE